MNSRRNINEMDTIMASVIGGQKVDQPQKKVKRRSLFRRKSKLLKQTPKWDKFDKSASTQASYQQAVFGKVKHRRTQRAVQTYHTIAIQIPALDYKKPAHWFKSHRKAASIFALMPVITYASVYGIRFALQKRAEKSEVLQASTTSITPPSVYTPHNLPTGFTVGSGTQQLDNGAVMYTVFDDEGRQIYITQQSKPQEFDEAMLQGSQKFGTPNGTGYVKEDPERITGFLFTASSWVLLNGAPGVSQDKMVELILGLGS
ncbi:MAG: hypothetical protein M3Q14_04080 [bacterium]|nr:hypothetical protein [bacterium]